VGPQRQLNRIPQRLVPLAVWGTWAAMVVALIGLVAGLGCNVPFSDDWDVLPWVSGQRSVEWSWLWQSYHDHRIPLPKMIWVAFGRLTGYDLRATMFFDGILLAGICAGLIGASARLRGRIAWTDAFFPLALLHWGQHQALLWSFGAQFVSSTILTLTILLILVSVRGLPTQRQGLMLGGCLVVLPLCGANGMLVVPPLAVWLIAAGVARWRSGRRDAVLWIGLAGAALVVVALAILGEKEGGTQTPHPNVTAMMQTAFQFFVMAVGPGGEMALPISALLLLLLVGFCVLSIVTALRRRPEERWRGWGLLCYLAALLGLGLAVGWGRAEIGGVTARYSTRFVTLAVPLLCWCYFAANVAPVRSAPLRAVPWVLCVLMLALLPLNIREGLLYGRGQLSILSSVEADIRQGKSPEEVAQRWQPSLYDAGPADPMPYRRSMQESLEWLRRTGQGPYKGQTSP